MITFPRKHTYTTAQWADRFSFPPHHTSCLPPSNLTHPPSHPLPQPTNLPPTSPLPRPSRIRAGLRLRAKHVPGPPPRLDQVVHIAHIVLRLAHVREPGAPRALRPPPDDLDAQHAGAVDLEPHLDADLGQVVPQQDRRVDARPPDREAHPRERRLPAPAPRRRHLEHVARLRRVRVLLREQRRPRPRRVEPPDLLRVVRD